MKGGAALVVAVAAARVHHHDRGGCVNQVMGHVLANGDVFCIGQPARTCPWYRATRTPLQPCTHASLRMQASKRLIRTSHVMLMTRHCAHQSLRPSLSQKYDSAYDIAGLSAAPAVDVHKCGLFETVRCMQADEAPSAPEQAPGQERVFLAHEDDGADMIFESRPFDDDVRMLPCPTFEDYCGTCVRHVGWRSGGVE